ncbi:MAG: type-F conjugative transfer system secretin TraK [Nitrospinae bacterium]|nr:type-F conjugative transfer system secretin TraK [Nitrospinota bacterium]
MTQLTRRGNAIPRALIRTLLLAAIFIWAAPASAMQILDAADGAELEAVISDRSVSRVTLADDRVARVVRGPDGFALEHDKSRGDLYLRPLESTAPAREALTLFIGTAKGFTYRLRLRTAARGSAQILIRNAAAAPRAESPAPREGRVGALVALVRAVALREVLPGYVIHSPSETSRSEGSALLETWRGRRFTARVYEMDSIPWDDSQAMMQNLAPGAAALWAAEPASGPSGGRIVVAVLETSRLRAAQ